MLQKQQQPQTTPTVAQEIEIKIKTSSENMKKIEAWLANNATFEGTEHHKEVYLDNPKSTFFFMHPNGEKDALKYLRVRFSNNGGSICFKNWYQDPKTGKTTHCDEYETKVSDPDVMLKLFEQLGYTDQTRMEKTRKKFSVDDYEIVIDDVMSLGIFVEIELKKQADNPIEACKELETFLVKKMGVTEYWIQNRGYVSRLRNPDIEFGEYKTSKK